MICLSDFVALKNTFRILALLFPMWSFDMIGLIILFLRESKKYILVQIMGYMYVRVFYLQHNFARIFDLNIFLSKPQDFGWPFLSNKGYCNLSFMVILHKKQTKVVWTTQTYLTCCFSTTHSWLNKIRNCLGLQFEGLLVLNLRCSLYSLHVIFAKAKPLYRLFSNVNL